MTEQNLYCSWFKKKTVKRFWLTVLLVNLTAWLLESTAYVEDLRFAIMRVKEKQASGPENVVKVYEFLQNNYCYLGIGCMIFCMLFLGAVIVHRESFFENWDVTLRRIPNFRIKYLVTKLWTMLLPGLLYLGYWGLQWGFRCKQYYSEVAEKLHIDEKKEIWKLIPLKKPAELCLYILLFAISILLLSFTLRKIRKDIIGFLVSIAGIVMTALLFAEVICFTSVWELLSVLVVLIMVVMVFLVRHIYRKL